MEVGADEEDEEVVIGAATTATIRNNISDTIANHATLEFFSNPQYMSILQQRRQVNKPENNTSEIKFYRKRITTLFKEMLKGEEANRDLNETHQKFVNMAIKYFEMMDKKDFIQSQHISVSNNILSDTSTMLPLDDPALETNLTLDEANGAMMRKIINVANLDNYVIMKQDVSANDVRIIPQIFEMDLKAPQLKMKGVKGKKIKNKEEEKSK
jgi:hypothetical protein